AAVEAVERADGGEERLLGDVLRGGGVVDDEEGGAVRARPVGAKERLEVGDGAGPRRPEAGPLVAARACHRAPTIRAPTAGRSIPGIRAGGPVRSVLGRHRLDLGCRRDLLYDLDDVAVRVEGPQLPVGAVAAAQDLEHALELPLGAALA